LALTNVSYGEAVGIHPRKDNGRGNVASPASQGSENRVSGQVEWPYGGSDERAGSENLRQEC
jgi:hypothetical protein